MKKIGIVMGSDSDMPVVSKAIGVLREYGVPYEVHVYSAHRTPEEARDFALTARERGLGAIIAAAGMGGSSRRGNCCKYNPPCYRDTCKIKEP